MADAANSIHAGLGKYLPKVKDQYIHFQRR